jgi:hypothetical protein
MSFEETLSKSDEIFEGLTPLSQGNLKDRVFQAILERLDTFPKEKLNLCDIFSHPTNICKFINLTAKYIGPDFPEAGKPFLIWIFMTIYPVFLEDDTQDSSKLMASLDQILNSLKPFVNFYMVNLEK